MLHNLLFSFACNIICSWTLFSEVNFCPHTSQWDWAGVAFSSFIPLLGFDKFEKTLLSLSLSLPPWSLPLHQSEIALGKNATSFIPLFAPPPPSAVPPTSSKAFQMRCFPPFTKPPWCSSTPSKVATAAWAKEIANKRVVYIFTSLGEGKIRHEEEPDPFQMETLRPISAPIAWENFWKMLLFVFTSQSFVLMIAICVVGTCFDHYWIDPWCILLVIIGSHYDGVDDDVFFIGDWEHGMLIYYIMYIIFTRLIVMIRFPP